MCNIFLSMLSLRANPPYPAYIRVVSFILFCSLTVFLTFGVSFAGEITVGMSAAFRGATGGLGSELFRGSMAYIEHINRNGGIHGNKLRIIAYDDGYNPVPAIKNTISLIDEDVFLLFDYVGTPTVTRILPILKSNEQQHIYLFFPFTGAQPHRQPPYDEFVFNLRASYQQETGGLVDNFVREGRKRIAVFYQVDAYGRSGWDGVQTTLAKYGLKIVGETTYRRGTRYSDSLKQQVEILKATNPDAIISIGAYAACAAFIRDARNSGLNVPIANVSFVGTEFLIDLLLEEGRKTGKDFTTNLVNSQVVPSYEDTSLPAVREYRMLMDKYNPCPPPELLDQGYKPLRYSFVSFEGFLNAKLLVAILKKMDRNPQRSDIRKTVEGIRGLDIGIDSPVSFGPKKHQGLDRVYYTTVRNGQSVPVRNWSVWKK